MTDHLGSAFQCCSCVHPSFRCLAAAKDTEYDTNCPMSVLMCPQNSNRGEHFLVCQPVRKKNNQTKNTICLCFLFWLKLCLYC